MAGGNDLAKIAEAIKDIFRQADKGNTGKIDRAILDKVMRKIVTENELSDTGYDKLLGAVDKGDSFISYTQFVDWVFTNESQADASITYSPVTASITCYWGCMSQPSRALKALLVDSGIPFTDRHVDMLKGENYGAEIRAINPAGQCPFLVLDGKVYTETIAMMRYLALKFPDYVGKYYPADIERRYEIDKWCDFYTSFFRPSFIKEYDVKFSCMMEKRTRNENDEYLIENARGHQKKAMKQLEAQLEQAGGKYILGDAMTLADYVLFCEMLDLKVLDLSIADYPRAMRYEADVMATSSGLNEIHKAGSAWDVDILPAFRAMMK